MIHFKNIRNLPNDELGIFIKEEIKKLTEEDYNEKESIEDMTGCNYYLIEDFDDLMSVITAEYSTTLNRYLNVVESAGVFDSFESILGGKYYQTFLACNNSGGPVHFIPSDIFEQCPNLKKSMEFTNAD